VTLGSCRVRRFAHVRRMPAAKVSDCHLRFQSSVDEGAKA
jgi:hypothetical protein